MGGNEMSEYVLELKDIVKKFPGVVALDHVQFQLKKGEIHALMGENGAGKSTFIKIITGVHAPNEGKIILKGEEVHFSSPLEASARNIAAIYQHSTAYPHLTVAENIFISHFKKKGHFLDWKYMYKETERLLKELGSTVDPRREMGSLTVAEQQIVEIAKAISANAEILIMDEPTAALSERECEQLYHIAEKLRDNGTSIIFISHRIEDMYRLASRVSVFRDGHYIATYDVEGLEKDKLISAMVGRDIVSLYPKRDIPLGDVVFKVESLKQQGVFADISFEVRAGEVLGFAGLVGAGRTELFEAIYGITSVESGKIYLDGKEVHFRHPQEAIEAGLGYLPEDRHRQGLVLDWEIYKNITLGTLSKYATIRGIDQKKEKQSAKQHSEDLSTKIQSVYDLADSLSGGNQQKVVVSKLLDSDLKVLVLDEPTKGVDVGAKSQIYEIIMDLAEKGYAIILISSEMPEVISMSDRIAVMSGGRIVDVVNAKEVTQEQVLEIALNVGKGR